MTKIIRIIYLLILSIIVLFSASSCAKTVSQEEYDRVINELTETANQVVALQNKLEEAKSTEDKYAELNTKYEDLKKQSEAKLNEIVTMESEYEELNTKYEDLKRQNEAKVSEIATMKAQYEELKKQYDAIIEQPVEIIEITEEDIEQTLFALINQERINNGEAELSWANNLFKVAQRNNHNMAESGKYQYDQTPAVQEIFWAIGYDTVEGIANAALVAWKNNPYQYKQNLLNKATIEGAVDAYTSGEIIYITYIAARFG
jgi:uncharacterized protein YkwD